MFQSSKWYVEPIKGDSNFKTGDFEICLTFYKLKIQERSQEQSLTFNDYCLHFFFTILQMSLKNKLQLTSNIRQILHNFTKETRENSLSVFFLCSCWLIKYWKTPMFSFQHMHITWAFVLSAHGIIKL